MGQEEITRLERWLTQNPRGEKFFPRPWETSAITQEDRVSPLLKFRIRPTGLLVTVGILFSIFGYLFHTKPVAALGVSLLGMICYCYQSARKNTLAWSLSRISIVPTVTEESNFDLLLEIGNHSDDTLPMVGLCVPFLGSRVRSYYHIEFSLRPRETRKVCLKLKADAGMGRFAVGKIKVTVRDSLALFYLCTEHEWQTWIEVVPNLEPIETFPWSLQGLSAQMGNFETQLGGESVSFLSLRDWRVGDTVRKIDWRKSLRMGELFVKDFERVVAADATLLIDQCAIGHSEFDGFSSMEKMRDSIISIIHFLHGQQLRTQLFSHTQCIPLHLSNRDVLSEAVGRLQPVQDNHFITLLEETEPLIPSDSIAMLLFCTGSVALEQLLPSIFRLEDRRVQTFLIAFDSKAFASVVAAEAHLSSVQVSIAQWYLDGLGKVNRQEDLGKLLSKISERSFVVTPNQSLQTQCSERGEL